MAIKHLQGKIGLPVICKIRKGEMVGNKPTDLPYFRFVSENPEVLVKVHELFGEKPVSFTAFLFGNDPFTAWMQSWSKSSLLKRCDGENIELELRGDKLEPCSKPCEFPSCQCKPNSTLKLMIRKIDPSSLFELSTNSKNDISHIDSVINGIKELALDTGIPLDKFPVLFTKEKVAVSVPMNGKRVRMDKYLIKIKVHPVFSSQLEKLKQIYNPNQKLLS